jgi:hypothetical protein
MRTCQNSDRDALHMVCGYPLPCPYHTVIIDASSDPTTVTMPVTSPALGNLKARRRLGDIAIIASKGSKRGR